MPWRAVLRVLAVAVAVAAALAIASLTLQDRIARNQAARVLATLQPLLPAGSYDNDPALDRILVSSPELPGSETEPLPVYRVRLHGAPVAAVLTVIEAGYAGPIRLLVAIAIDGTILGVAVEAHRETPGIGDRIERSKSDWLTRFTGRSLDDPPQSGWTLRAEGGAFDEITGATTTSAAVVSAVRDAMLYFQAHRDHVFAAAPE
jgi:electron transport complex protein RnfG